LGGEKLKSVRYSTGVFFTLVLLAANFLFASFPLSAQTRGDPQTDESAIILDDAPAAPASEGVSSIFVVLRMVLVLALAAVAIYGAVFFIKRLARPRESRDPHLKLLARLPLGSDAFAAVVSVGAKAWLIGCGSGNINLISEIDDTEALESMLLDDANTAEDGVAFTFRALLEKLGKSSPDGTGSHAERLRKQRERLR
jgi:flagellar protein FliO/FliZ